MTVPVFPRINPALGRVELVLPAGQVAVLPADAELWLAERLLVLGREARGLRSPTGEERGDE